MNDVESFFFKRSRTIWLAICLVFVTLIGINTLSSRNTIIELQNLQKEIRNSSNVVSILRGLHVRLLKAESGQRGFVMTNEEIYLEHYQTSLAEIKEGLAQIPETVSFKEQQGPLFQEIVNLMNRKIKSLELAVEQARSNQFISMSDLIASEDGRDLYDQINQLFDKLDKNEREIRAAQVDELQMATDEYKTALWFSFVTSLILVFGIYFLARLNVEYQRKRQVEVEQQNQRLKDAVGERTKELSLFSEELSRSNRELQDFAFVASHDLQEPLRKIMAFGERIASKSDALSEKQKDYLARMRGAAGRMSTLINDLLEFSRVNSKGKEFTEVDLNSVIEECIDDLSVLIDESGSNIKTLPSLPIINADPTQMRQLFFNLLNNAVKFSKNSDSPTVAVEIEMCEQPDGVMIEDLSNWYKISIVDNGIGFEDEYAEKIFAPFQRLHSRDQYEGTGIGLAVCRRIVERHNGVIEASSIPSKRTIFSIVIPASNRLISIKYATANH